VAATSAPAVKGPLASAGLGRYPSVSACWTDTLRLLRDATVGPTQHEAQSHYQSDWTVDVSSNNCATAFTTSKPISAPEDYVP